MRSSRQQLIEYLALIQHPFLEIYSPRNIVYKTVIALITNEDYFQRDEFLRGFI